MAYPFTAGEELTAALINLVSEINQIDITAGENIDASSVPLAVYLKASDGKVYKTDTDADESAFKFIGFVGGAQNVLANATVVVTTGGVLGGFSLTAGNRMYLSGTAGVLATSPTTARGIEIGLAVSATELFIYPKTNQVATFSDSVGAGTTEVTNVITIGFRPRLIIGVASVTGSGSNGRSVFIVFGDTGGMMAYNEDNPALSASIETSYIVTSVQDADDQPHTVINAVSTTGFSIVYTRGTSSGTSGTVRGIAIG